MTNDQQSIARQPIGRPVPGWSAAPQPPRTPLVGRHCRVEHLDVDRHASSLYDANAHDRDGRNWTYLAYGPFESRDAYEAWMRQTCLGADPLFYAIVDLSSGKAIGVASYLRIDPNNGVIEVGHINFSPLLQRTPLATEAMHLMMKHVFELGYRRYEWKCDSLNVPSRAAARRLGFTYEGTFRQATVYKGRNRDTAWFSILDSEWPAFDRAFQAWLDPSNFDAQGRQRLRLADLTRAVPRVAPVEP